MWLDAFIKPKSTDTQKSGVSGVSGVSSHRQPNEYAASPDNHTKNTEVFHGVSGVSVSGCETPETPRNTVRAVACFSHEPPRQPNEYEGLANSETPETPETPKKHNVPAHEVDIADVSALFRFDLVQADINAGYPADELRRVNNLTWRLMTTKGFEFVEALTAAAEWVAFNPPHSDEKTFVDVQLLFNRMAPHRNQSAIDTNQQ